MQLIMILLQFLVSQSSIYGLSVPDTQGGSIDFNELRGKKLLLVNIATGSARAGQLGELQQLQQQYSDSLIVIGFPTDDFSHESRSNADIKTFCQSQYGVSFLLAAKASVKGGALQPAYGWLTRQSENGIMDGEVQDDFQKYLVSSQGQLIGVFAGQVSPLDQQVTDAITAH